MKTYCLAVLLAMAILMGILATGATATTLCEVTGNNCPAGKRYPVPQKFQASLTAKTVFKIAMPELATVECNESELAGETYENTGKNEFLRAEIGVWELSHNGGACVTQGGGKCTTAQWVLPAYASFISAGGNGVIKFHRLQKGELILEVNCLGIKCLYATLFIEAEFQGGGPGEAVVRTAGAKLAKALGSGFLCPANATVSFEYTFSEPGKALWIAGEP